MKEATDNTAKGLKSKQMKTTSTMTDNSLIAPTKSTKGIMDNITKTENSERINKTSKEDIGVKEENPTFFTGEELNTMNDKERETQIDMGKKEKMSPMMLTKK
eukprot:7830222-Ditylum_brightwellii.AAC.1